MALAMAHLQRQDLGAALASANQLIADNPRTPAGYVLAGFAQLRAGRTQPARDLLTQALAIDPANS